MIYQLFSLLNHLLWICISGPTADVEMLSSEEKLPVLSESKTEMWLEFDEEKALENGYELLTAKDVKRIKDVYQKVSTQVISLYAMELNLF